MKIAYILHSLNLGGTERLAADMSVALKDRFEMHILCLDEPGLWADQVRDQGIPVTCFYRQPGLDMRLPGMIANYARTHHIELYHAHQCTPWFYTGLSRLIYSSPQLLFEEHGRLYPEVLNKKKRLFNHLILQHLTHKVVAVSQDVKERLFSYEGVSKSKTEVVYNGARPALPLPMEKRKLLRQRFGFKETDIVAGSIGRLDPIKNYVLFMEGIAQARQLNPALKGIIIGDGPLMNDLTQYIKKQNIEDAFILPGYRHDAASLVGIMDLFVLPSFSEGTSMALLESMAASIPAIVTKVGGNPEIVIHGQTGWVIPSNDLKAMTSALKAATRDRETREYAGLKAQVKFKKTFTFDTMLNSYIKIYRNLIDHQC